MTPELKPCKYCGKPPYVTHKWLPYRSCWHIECRNDECNEKPRTWYYYKMADAVAEWQEMMK